MKLSSVFACGRNYNVLFYILQIESADFDNVGECLMLIITEVGELLKSLKTLGSSGNK